MALAWRDWFHRGLLACLVLILAASSVAADDCKGVPNILVSFRRFRIHEGEGSLPVSS